jgi:hypothetical protein
MGLFSWIKQKADTKLRLAQIKILYQNQSAISFLQEQLRDAKQMGHLGDETTFEALEMFEQYTSDCILELAWKTVLSEQSSRQLLEINNGLKNLYAGMQEGSRRFRSMVGQPLGDLTPFASRFSPASGWEKFSETEWDLVVRKAADQLPKT